MATIGTLTANLTLESATFVNNLSKSAQAMDRTARQMQQQTTLITRGFDRATSAAKAFAAGLVASLTAGAVTGLSRLAKDALDAAGNLGELATQAGVTTRELQSLQLAGVQVGVSSEQMTKALAQFGVRVGEAALGTGELKDTLERYGIATRNSAGQVRASTEVLGDLADAVERAGSEQEKLAIVADAFGARVGPKLLPLLADGAEGFREWGEAAEAAGLILGQDLSDAADRASDGIATLQFAIAKGFEIGVVREFADAVNVTAENIKAARLAGEAFGRVIGGALALAVDAMRSLQPFFETTAREFRALADLLQRFFEFVGVPFSFAEDAAEAASGAIKPLEVDIRKAFTRTEELTDSTKKLADATDKLTGAQKRLAEAGKILLQTSAQEERYDERAEQRIAQWERMSRLTTEFAQRAESAWADVAREQERQAEITEDLATEPFRNALTNIQNLTTDTFEQLYSGGIDSFEDLADSIKQIFIRLAAELSTLALFKGLTGQLSFGGLGGGLFGTSTAVGAPLVPGGVPVVTPGAPGFFSTGAGAFTAGAAGVAGGSVLGGAVGGNQNNAMIGATTGALAGAAIGSIVPGIGTAIGAFAGALIGGLAGGFIGGGGEDTGVSASLGRGKLGDVFASQEIAPIVRDIDNGLLDMLDIRQERLANRLLQDARSVSVQFGEEGPSANDLSRLAGARIAPTARALGFRESAIAGGGRAPEEQLQLLQEAIQLERTIEDLTGKVTPFQRQMRDLRTQFEEAEEKAREFGISTKGLSKALREAEEELREERKLEREAGRFELDVLVGAGDPFQLAILQIERTFDDARKTADELGLSTRDLAKAEREAIRAVHERREAEVEALSRSVTAPFEALAAPLEAFQRELDLSILNPAELFQRAREDFRRTAAQAEGGDLEAIDQLDEAARFFIDQAGRAGAAPLQADAIREVRAVTTDVLRDVEKAQRDAALGIEAEVRRASQREIDTIRELIEVGRDTVAEIKKLRR